MGAVRLGLLSTLVEIVRGRVRPSGDPSGDPSGIRLGPLWESFGASLGRSHDC